MWAVAVNYLEIKTYIKMLVWKQIPISPEMESLQILMNDSINK